ncbi:MAG: hypothetical protein IKU35_06585 [Bacteroidaceae bacterium]|nr:hypothetical protein [Bacteroidaceae bacterium]
MSYLLPRYRVLNFRKRHIVCAPLVVKADAPIVLVTPKTVEQGVAIWAVPVKALFLCRPHTVATTCRADLEADIAREPQLDGGLYERPHLLQLRHGQFIIPPIKDGQFLTNLSNLEPDLAASRSCVARVSPITLDSVPNLCDTLVDVLQYFLCV